MTHYYQDERAGITIYHADSRELLPQIARGGVIKIDLILTDPPYGVNAVGRSGVLAGNCTKTISLSFRLNCRAV
jgi:DNA modification methylase